MCEVTQQLDACGLPTRTHAHTQLTSRAQRRIRGESVSTIGFCISSARELPTRPVLSARDSDPLAFASYPH